jgi:hypothetical protein
MIVGYARVSTDGQTLDAQQAALRQASCERVFGEKVSGAKTDRQAAPIGFPEHYGERSGAVRSKDSRRPLYATVVARFAVRPRSAICATSACPLGIAV